MTRVVRAELLKFRTTPGPWVVVLVALVLTALSILTTFATAAVGPHHPAFAAPRSVGDLRLLVGAGYLAAEILAPILGVLCITTEYRHQVVTTTLLITPRREQVLVGKGVASVVWGLLLCAATLVLVGAMGIPWLLAEGGSTARLLAQVGPVVPGLLGVFALLALFGLGIGVLLRNQVAGVLVTLGIVLLLEPLIVALFHGVFHIDLNVLPSQAAASVAGGLVRRGNGTATGRLLPWWQGGLALLAWGLVPGILGYFTTFRRDVT